MQPLHHVDPDAFLTDLKALRADLDAAAGEEDVEHLGRMAAWGRVCSILGWGTAWIAPNPLSILGISQGIVTRWCMIGHHVLHRGYDRLPGVPKRFTSKEFARGARSFLDWHTWMDVEAWCHEHNRLHHHHTSSGGDPDLVERQLAWLRDSGWPVPVRYLVLAVLALTWRQLYYPFNNLACLDAFERRRAGEKDAEPVGHFELRAWLPTHPVGRRIWARFVPVFLLKFVIMPLPFLLLGTWAWASVVVNVLLAELFANLYTASIIVTNHTGADLPRFDDWEKGQAEFYVRQIISAANFRTGGDLNDFLHGWLNYQIEHHVWSDLSMRQYQLAQPRLKALCEKHGIPYVQESVFTRMRKTMQVAVGTADMPRLPGRAVPAA